MRARQAPPAHGGQRSGWHLPCACRHHLCSSCSFFSSLIQLPFHLLPLIPENDFRPGMLSDISSSCALCVLAGLQQTASKRRRVKNVQSRERSHFLPSPFGPCPQLNINTKKYKYRKKYKHKTGKGTISSYVHSLQMWY